MSDKLVVITDYQPHLKIYNAKRLESIGKVASAIAEGMSSCSPRGVNEELARATIISGIESRLAALKMERHIYDFLVVCDKTIPPGVLGEFWPRTKVFIDFSVPGTSRVQFWAGSPSYALEIEKQSGGT